MHWFPAETIDRSASGGEELADAGVPVESYAGKTVSLVVRVAYGGPHGVFNEEAFFDEISVVPQSP